MLVELSVVEQRYQAVLAVIRLKPGVAGPIPAEGTDSLFGSA
jgi:hypothetical protein